MVQEELTAYYWQERTHILLGFEKMNRLHDAHVLIAGAGGVGSYAAEMLGRAGIGHITIIDSDTIQPTNLNRQLIALHSTLGINKAEVTALRLQDINPEISVKALPIYLDEANIHTLFSGNDYHFVVDAIDTVDPKCRLIYHCVTTGVPIVSAMGAGAKTDISRIRIDSLWKTKNCPLSKVVRQKMRHLGMGNTFIPVVYSDELPKAHAIIPVNNERNKKSTCGTVSYMPAVFGCYLAWYVIDHL